MPNRPMLSTSALTRLTRQIVGLALGVSRMNLGDARAVLVGKTARQGRHGHYHWSHMRFSKHFSVRHAKGTDWFDPLLDQDTPLYVDPFLVYDDKKPLWRGARQEVVDFFDTAAQLIERANGNVGSPAYDKALRLLRFPEPNEFALGLSMGKPQGAGTGVDFAKSMAGVLDLAHRHGHVADLASIEGFRLFEDGIGRDRVSDILCNILKHRFIKYTQEIVARRGIPTETVMVRHADWDRRNGRWIDKRIDLPKSPETTGASS